MVTLSTDVLVIGGGATGTGIAWDAALRGLGVILVERGGLAQGTSGHFHGLLHSGARYAVNDPATASDCITENRILRRIAADCIEDTGGLFVCTQHDDPAYAGLLATACERAGVPCEEISIAQALRQEPCLDAGIVRALRVPDASVDGRRLVHALAEGAHRYGARILPHHALAAFRREADSVAGARVRDRQSGEEVEIQALVTINATGPWAGEVARLAGIESVRVLANRGTMVSIGPRLADTALSRCRMPSDGDVIVPVGPESVLGTTGHPTDDPADLSVDQRDVDQLLQLGEQLIPGLRDAHTVRAWSAVRPLFDVARASADGTRATSRSHALLDHATRDGVRGLITVTGGKLTTFRLMAEQTVDCACSKLGDQRPCTTATQPLTGAPLTAEPHDRPAPRAARLKLAPARRRGD